MTIPDCSKTKINPIKILQMSPKTWEVDIRWRKNSQEIAKMIRKS